MAAGHASPPGETEHTEQKGREMGGERKWEGE